MIEFCVRLTCPPAKEVKCEDCMCACHPKESVGNASDIITESQIELCKCYLRKQKELEKMRASLIEEAKRRKSAAKNTCPKECTCDCERHQQQETKDSSDKSSNNCPAHCTTHCPKDDGCTKLKSMTGMSNLKSIAGAQGEQQTGPVGIDSIQNYQNSTVQPASAKLEGRTSVAKKITSAFKFGKGK